MPDNRTSQPPVPPAGNSPSRLDLERTALANERTLLAFVRTTIAFFIGGGSLMKFFDSRLLQFLGAASLVLGAAVMLIGWNHYFKTRRLIREFRIGNSADR